MIGIVDQPLLVGGRGPAYAEGSEGRVRKLYPPPSGVRREREKARGNTCDDNGCQAEVPFVCLALAEQNEQKREDIRKKGRIHLD